MGRLPAEGGAAGGQRGEHLPGGAGWVRLGCPHSARHTQRQRLGHTAPSGTRPGTGPSARRQRRGARPVSRGHARDPVSPGARLFCVFLHRWSGADLHTGPARARALAERFRGASATTRRRPLSVPACCGIRMRCADAPPPAGPSLLADGQHRTGRQARGTGTAAGATGGTGWRSALFCAMHGPASQGHLGGQGRTSPAADAVLVLHAHAGVMQ